MRYNDKRYLFVSGLRSWRVRSIPWGTIFCCRGLLWLRLWIDSKQVAIYKFSCFSLKGRKYVVFSFQLRNVIFMDKYKIDERNRACHFSEEFPVWQRKKSRKAWETMIIVSKKSCIMGRLLGSFITIIDKLSMVLICELHANRHFTLREIYVPPPHRLLAKHHVCREWFTPNGSKTFFNSLTEYFAPRFTKQTADEIMIIILLYNSGWWVKGRWGWNNEFQFYWQLIKFSTFCLWKCQS